MQEKRIHEAFTVSLAIKGLNGLAEIAGGIAIYLTSTETIARWIAQFANALGGNPKRWIPAHLLKFGDSLTVSQHDFVAFYLLTHGVVKIVLVYGLLRERLWSYPVSFVVFSGYIIYQLYRFTFTHSLLLIVLSIFDAFILTLAVHEYRLVRRNLPTH
ncbi:MAG TPA: DUF2127 domain-containing protein [Sphingomicrobium sp.]|nr:DUF2127 domain-containing protein [Sphingomicrobium sp.]